MKPETIFFGVSSDFEPLVGWKNMRIKAMRKWKERYFRLKNEMKKQDLTPMVRQLFFNSGQIVLNEQLNMRQSN